jgi:hypothetical protein
MMDIDCLCSPIISFGVSECGFDVRNPDIKVLGKILTMSSKSLLKSFGAHAREHYPDCSYGVYPIEDDSAVAILLVANRYSPNNFW